MPPESRNLRIEVPGVPVAQPRPRGKYKSHKSREEDGRSLAAKATDAEIVAAYEKAKSVWGAAKLLGMCGQSVHERLVKMGANKRMNRWTIGDDVELSKVYARYANDGKLDELAGLFGRTKHFICRQARRLGLTDQRRERTYIRVWKGISEDQARVYFEKFRQSSLGLGAYCRKFGIDDLGFSMCMKEHFPDEYEHVIESKTPRQTKYRLGRQVEYAVRDDLKRRGYPVVLRSPRSGGPVDILAVKTGSVLLVQCKRGMSIKVSEWNTLVELANSVGAVPVLAGRPTGRGLVYKQMIGKKDGSKRPQPMVDLDP